MGWYDNEKNVEEYIHIAEGYDGKELIERLQAHLEPGSSVLELGTGPGTDLEILNRSFRAVGSDNSQIFIKRCRKTHPNAELMLLDAVTLKTAGRFDAVYSNKVMHHLSYEQMAASFMRQYSLLNPGGIALHSFWYGSEIENYDGMLFHQLTEDSLRRLLPDCFEIIEQRRYTEMDRDDSFYVILKLKKSD